MDIERKYLPAAEELEEMSLKEFDNWKDKAVSDLRERQIKRDPLTHLRKRILHILKDESVSEVKKEERVLNIIINFYNEP